MSCIAGVGGNVKKLVKTAQSGRKIIAIDGCPLACAKACGANPKDCVVIEDSPAGARAAIAAGIPVFGFAAHGEDTPTAQGLKALNIPLFRSMRDLPALLGL